MKTKALILGAMPPFEGPTVSLSESKMWEIEVTTLPVGVDLGEALELHVEYPNRNITLKGHCERFIGNALSIQAVLADVEDVDIVSVSATEVENVDDAA